MYLILVTLVLLTYVNLEGLFGKWKDDNMVEMKENPEKTYTLFEQYQYDIYVNANVLVYSILIIVLGTKYNNVAKTFVETMNIQF